MTTFIEYKLVIDRPYLMKILYLLESIAWAMFYVNKSEMVWYDLKYLRISISYSIIHEPIIASFP